MAALEQPYAALDGSNVQLHAVSDAINPLGVTPSTASSLKRLNGLVCFAAFGLLAAGLGMPNWGTANVVAYESCKIDYEIGLFQMALDFDGTVCARAKSQGLDSSYDVCPSSGSDDDGISFGFDIPFQSSNDQGCKDVTTVRTALFAALGLLVLAGWAECCFFRLKALALPLAAALNICAGLACFVATSNWSTVLSDFKEEILFALDSGISVTLVTVAGVLGLVAGVLTVIRIPFCKPKPSLVQGTAIQQEHNGAHEHA